MVPLGNRLVCQFSNCLCAIWTYLKVSASPNELTAVALVPSLQLQTEDRNKHHNARLLEVCHLNTSDDKGKDSGSVEQADTHQEYCLFMLCSDIITMSKGQCDVVDAEDGFCLHLSSEVAKDHTRYL